MRTEAAIRELYERVHVECKQRSSPDAWALLHTLDWVLGLSDGDPLTGDIPTDDAESPLFSDQGVRTFLRELKQPEE